MSKPTLALTIRDQDKRVANALAHHHAATASAAQMAVSAALCGLELKAIKKEIGHGGWGNFFDTHFAGHGLSERTGRNYIALAEGLKSKTLKSATVADLKLLEAAPSTLSAAQQQTLAKHVGRLTDGATLTELYQDYGIVKRPQGHGAKGGDTSQHRTAKPTPEEQAELAQAEAKVNTAALCDLLADALKEPGRYWNLCDTATKKKLHGLLEDARVAVKGVL